MSLRSSLLPDPCPACCPGDHPAIVPQADPVADIGGLVRADYVHAACGASWSAWWDAADARMPSATAVPLYRAGAAPESRPIVPALLRDSRLKAKAALQVAESRMQRGATERKAS